jgi:DeoR family transcriptional regulator, suf operon transcriptional repressor
LTRQTRDIILRTLRARGKCSVTQLAEASSVSPVSVRHHLANLQAENLVVVENEHHGVGRPRQLFSLTEAGLDLFPSRYVRFTNRLLDEIKQSIPGGKVEKLFSSVASSMAANVARQLEGLPLERRLERMIELLAEEGFDAQIEQQEGRILVHELSCPYFRVGLEHPEVCTMDQAFLATALSLRVERVTCVLEGADTCTFAAALEPDTREPAT